MTTPTLDPALTRRFELLAEALHGRFPDRLTLGYRPPRGVDAFWASPPTPAEQAQYDALLGMWDWSPRRPRDLMDLKTSLKSLTAADRAELLIALLAEHLRENPRLARTHGIALDGDEEIA